MAYTPWAVSRPNRWRDPLMQTESTTIAQGATVTVEESGKRVVRTGSPGRASTNAGQRIAVTPLSPLTLTARRTVPVPVQGAGVTDGRLEVVGYDSTGSHRSNSYRVRVGSAPAMGSEILEQTITPPEWVVSLEVNFYTGGANGDAIIWDRVGLIDPPGEWLSGGSIDTDLQRTRWLGTADASASVLETRQTIPEIPIRNLSTQEVLYGDRVTTYRWEVLEHSNGIDQLVGILDGVSEGRLTWTQNAAVKGGGKVQIADLDVAEAGKLRIGDLALESVRLRPVCVVQGLPENPLGVFLLSNAKEEWEDTGRVWNISLLDKNTVPDQDKVDQSYSVAAGTLILQQVKTILASAGEFIAINASSTLATSSNMVWEAGTSKLKIINDLLDVAGYNALWMDGQGNFQATPRVLPADRSILYEVLGIPRELKDGKESIYRPDWSRDRDSYDVPNKVIAVQAADGGDTGALVGQWTNEDPDSPYSYISRGRWIVHVLDSVECPEGTNAEITTFLNNRARATLIQMSAVQAQVKVEHLPVPMRVGDVIQFANTRAGVDARHVVTRMELDTTPLGMMRSNLQEVISL